ncbi:MAG TPA: GtrA family protein [Acidimicrobiales bacterium]|nr:GtrA family protein [Acidimicrobiales bacterium]
MAGLMTRARGPKARRLYKYSLVSVVAVAVGQAVLALCFGVLHWSAAEANVAACAAGTVPSYILNRRWVWGKGGRSHLVKEVLPFWFLAFLGLVLSTLSASVAEGRAADITSHRFGQTLIVMAANLGAFGVLWLGKFFFFEKVLFAHDR